MNAPLWTAAEAAAATHGRATRNWTATGVSIDSRTLEPGDLFVALRGPTFDGHDFVAAALDAGAAAALVHRVPDGVAEDAPLLVVANADAALDDLAAAARSRARARICAVTGSVGKTGAKETLARALGAIGPTVASRGNLNNQWGAPLSLARLPADAAYGVFELGMNASGEIGPLSRLVRPHIAVITTITAAHLENFDGVAGIADAKAEIFEGMGPDGVAILNRDNAYFPHLAVAARERGVGRVIGFGAHPEAEVRLRDLNADNGGSRIAALVGGRELVYRLGVPGRHWAINSLAALAAVDALGADVGRAAGALATMEAPRGRGKQHRVACPGGHFTLIDDSYNASPASMRAAFAVLGASETGPGGRRLAVLGDMLELGDRAEELHAGLAPALEAAAVDRVFTAGPHMAALDAALPAKHRAGHAAAAEDLLTPVLDAVQAGDVVLVKGSLGMAMAQIVEALLDAAATAGERQAC